PIAGAEAPLSAATVDRILALLGMAEWAPLGPRDVATPGPTAAARDPFVDAVMAVLVALVADGPLVLVVDGAQWAAGALLRAFGRLGGTLAGPLLLVVVGRSDLLGSDWWRDLPGLEVLPVAPLDDTASERLLRAYLGDADLDPETRDVLLARAHGNPFF